MFFNTLAASSLLVASALAVAEPAPYKLGSMSFNNAFGLAKRQAGYAPSQTYCGPGTDCATSCGAGYIQCASTDSELHCYDPDIKQSCCPDGSGNSCDDGYFCTSDTTGGTWCCPNGLSLASCAAAYSLTDVLVSEVATAAPATTASATLVSVSITTTPAASTSTSSSKVAATASTSSSSTASVVKVSPSVSSNGTATTTSPPLQVTNAAGQIALGGLPALALAAGAFLAL